MPDAFIHYSTSNVSVFTPTPQCDGYFRTRTQGFLYVTPFRSKVGSSTVLSRPKSALLFVDDAARCFKRHPRWDLYFFKRLLGQWVSRKRYHDWGWKFADVTLDGDVLVITKIYPIAMTAGSRLDREGVDSAQTRLARMKRNCWLALVWYIVPFICLFALALMIHPLNEFLMNNTGLIVKVAAWVIIAAVPVGMLLKFLTRNAALEKTLAKWLPRP